MKYYKRACYWRCAYALIDNADRIWFAGDDDKEWVLGADEFQTPTGRKALLNDYTKARLPKRLSQRAWMFTDPPIH